MDVNQTYQRYFTLHFIKKHQFANIAEHMCVWVVGLLTGWVSEKMFFPEMSKPSGTATGPSEPTLPFNELKLMNLLEAINVAWTVLQYMSPAGSNYIVFNESSWIICTTIKEQEYTKLHLRSKSQWKADLLVAKWIQTCLKPRNFKSSVPNLLLEKRHFWCQNCAKKQKTR